MLRSLLLTGLMLCTSPLLAQSEARLLRFPTIHDDTIVFTYAGDLYSVPAAGGVARKLTNHVGFEMFARFSPDGKHLAFTGQYDGNTEVYLMPSEGGVPRRLTYTATLGRDDVGDRMGPNNIVMGWKHNGKEILFRSRMRTFNDFIGQLYTVSIDGGLPEELPLPRGGFGSYSPDDSKLVYNRVFREFRTWKRYRGGMADDLWVYDFATKQTEQLVKDAAQDIIPMWHGQKVYFLSDRDANKRMNLWVMNLADKTVKAITTFADYDVKFPSLGNKAIVFENGGFIYKYDLTTEKLDQIKVRILEDFASGRGGLVKVNENITSYEMSPDGKRGLFGARGEVFTVPNGPGRTLNLTNSSGVHERNSKWSPDGKHIAFVSDATGEDEIHIVPADGSDVAKPITSGDVNYKYAIYWSPDSKKILWADRKQRLQFVDVTTKQVVKVAESKAFEIREYTWSPDSKWVAYSLPQTRAMTQVMLYSLDQNRSIPVTDEFYTSFEPSFSADGKYLFFGSNRDFNPTYGNTEFNHIYRDMTKVYMVLLAKDTPSPFAPKNDEVPAVEPKKADTVTVKVDADGLLERTLSLNVSASNYRAIVGTSGGVYYMRGGKLYFYDLAANKENDLGNVGGFELSPDGKKMLVSRESKYYIVDAPRGALNVGAALDLGGLEMRLNRHEEWRQIFMESWRQMRDFLYDPNMHGNDWLAIRKRYEVLLPHIQHRQDLNYIIGEMIGELNLGHAYVNGGDIPSVPKTPMGLLGAELKQDAATKYYRVTKVLKGTNWDRGLRSPLGEIDVNVKVGEFIVAINGKPTNEVPNIYDLLINTVGKQVILKVNTEPSLKGARTVTVVPIADESKLYYFDWVQTNIEKVNKATNGEVGYLHIPDMLQSGLNEFTRYYYPQLSKKSLIIDVRGNGGGNVSPQIIERLRRQIAMISIARNTDPSVEPGGTFNGPLVCLMNEFSASDGDIFPYRFRHYKLGPLIGKRSWGGVVGIRGSLPFVDGGDLRKPEFSRYDVNGKEWIMEGYGVDPDIVVDNDPAKEFAGIDEQLNKAIEIALERVKKEWKPIPPPPPTPKR